MSQKHCSHNPSSYCDLCIEALEASNLKMKMALEFYADPKTNADDHGSYEIDGVWDGGKIAKEALGEKGV